MAHINVASLASATNLVYTKLNEATAADATGRSKDALTLCREAVAVACQTMREFFDEHGKELSTEIPLSRDKIRLREVLQNRESVKEFLDAEERLLKQVGLDPSLVNVIMNRCIDFLEKDPNDLDPKGIAHAFAAVRFRVCDDSVERLAKATESSSKYSWMIEGRTALRAAIGGTIIGANYVFFGPTEAWLQLSTGYGLSWLPIWPLGQK